MSNRTFSIKKNRELSIVEARIGSFRRRLTDPLGRRNTIEGQASSTASREHSTVMPKGKRRGRDASWEPEASSREEDDVNASGDSNIDNQNGVAGHGEYKNDSGNDRTTNHANGGRRPQNKSSQQNRQPGLGPWADAVRETVHSLGTANQAINDLQGIFASHMKELAAVDETKNKLTQLEEAYKEREEEIEKQENTITTLTKIDQKVKANIERRAAELQQKEDQLDQEKSKQERRVTMATAEERLKLKNQYEQLMKEQGRSYDDRRKELENEFSQKRDENNKLATALMAEKQELLAAVDKQNMLIEVQTENLKQTTEQCDTLKRAKDSVKMEMRDRERELAMMKEELGLNSKPEEYFKQKFSEIYRLIRGISLKYFHDIEKKDLEIVHGELVKADPLFRTVPINDGDDSHDLRAAHAQRIISNAICKYIWRPLSSECTILNPEFNNFLGKISDVLRKPSVSGHAANVWTALTVRALDSLPVNSLSPRVSDAKEGSQLARLTRAEHVVSNVQSVLSPLVNASQNEKLEAELFQLVDLAIEVWHSAQTGELEIIVRSPLELAHREEWRSLEFDPAEPSLNRDETDFEVASRAPPRIITLFPRVVARKIVDPVKHAENLPGSWPLESDHTPRTLETCIHPGSGLPQWSPLVVRGKEEEEERNDYLQKVLEDAKKELHINRRTAGHSRRESMAGSTLVQSSESRAEGGQLSSHIGVGLGFDR